MSAPESVLGVLALCWVELTTLHSCKPRGSRLTGGLCKVCKVYVRARARTELSQSLLQATWRPLFSYARTKNPYTPYTPYTDALKALILLGSRCVGFVLGWGFLCWVGFGEGDVGHE